MEDLIILNPVNARMLGCDHHPKRFQVHKSDRSWRVEMWQGTLRQTVQSGVTWREAMFTATGLPEYGE